MDKRVITKRTVDISELKYSDLYDMLSYEFDKTFLRRIESQILAFRHRDYRVSYIDKCGFGLWWCFERFSFLEYIVIEKMNRGQGMGSLILNAIKSQSNLVIVEVHIGDKVKDFYLKNGFKECQMDYFPIQINEEPQKGLMLMSYNHTLSEAEYSAFIKKISMDELQF
jgi:hypothetical protein